MKRVALFFLFLFYKTFLSPLSSHRLIQGTASSSRSFSLFGAKSLLGFACAKWENKQLLLISVHAVCLLESKKGSSFYFERNTRLRNLWHNFILSYPAFLPRNGGTVFISGSCKLSEMSTTGIKKQTMNQVQLVCQTLFCQKYVLCSGGGSTWKCSKLHEISEIWYLQCFLLSDWLNCKVEYMHKNEKTTRERC